VSHLEDELAAHITYAGLPPPEREYRFAPPRRYRADFAWPDRRVIAEVEGGTYSGGRHVRPKGYENDCNKYNLAALGGWRVFRFTGGMVRDGSALATIEEALGHDDGH
jgi:Uncharacterized protein conserved in bacteria